MKIDSKKILTIGAGAVVGYLIFCKFMKRAGAKSLEEGTPSEEGMGGGGGGGGGGFGGGGIGGGSLPPVANPPYFLQQNITPPKGYVVIGDNLITQRENLAVGNPNALGGGGMNANTQAGRETPPTPTPPPSTQMRDVSGAVVSSANKSKFADFDGDANFQDQLL